MRYVLISIGLVISLAACRPNAPEPSASIEEDRLPTDFVQFYARFHSDSTYQMQHVIFPLPGKEADSTGRTYWIEEEWKVHNLSNFDEAQFEHEFELMNDRLIVETHYHKQVPYVVMRHWVELEGGWQLSYYGSKMGSLGGEKSDSL